VIYLLLAFGAAAAAYQLLALAAGLRQALRRETPGTFRPPFPSSSRSTASIRTSTRP